jgi:hypothetical protein
VIFSYSLNNSTRVNELGNKNEELGIMVYPNPATSYVNKPLA